MLYHKFQLKKAAIFDAFSRHSEEQRDMAISFRQILMRLLRRNTPRNDVTPARQKAAMFGLDARIALAIFGALSIITGAALYSAIGNAKVTALVTELEEVGKAYDTYIFDTGNTLNKAVSGDVYVAIDNLVQNTLEPVTGWKGPYLQYPDWSSGSRHGLRHAANEMIYLVRSEKALNTVIKKCEGINTCYIVTGMTGCSLNLAIKIDEKIDGVIDREDGNFRYSPGDPAHIYYYYRTAINNQTY